MKNKIEVTEGTDLNEGGKETKLEVQQETVATRCPHCGNGTAVKLGAIRRGAQTLSGGPMHMIQFRCAKCSRVWNLGY